jgi:hypothetical protein
VNCATVGAAGVAGGVVAVGGGGGGAGGGSGTFFLHPSAKSAIETTRQTTEIFRLLNMNIAS